MRWAGRALLLPLLAFVPARVVAQESALLPAEAERRAVDFSPALKAAEARIRIEEGRLRQAGLYPNPDAALDGTWLAGGGNRETVLSLRQPIPWPAWRDLARREALERVEAARLERDRVRLDLLLEVRGAYDRLYFAAAILKVEEEDLEATRELRKAAEARVAAGDAPPFEALKAAVEVSRAESDLGRAKGELLSETASINLLLGLSPGTPISTAEPPVDPGQGATGLPALIERALERQPEVQAAQRQAQAARLASERARVERRPEVGLGPTLGTDHGEWFLGAGVTLKLPVWNRNQGAIAAAAAASDEASALLESVRLSLSRQVADSYDRFLAARAQKEMFEGGLLDTSARMLEKARQAYRGGETGILEFLDARRTALAVREEYLRSSLDAALAAARLRRAAGEDLPEASR